MTMIKLYFAGQITDKVFQNYGPGHRGNIYLNSRHLKPLPYNRNAFTTVYTIHPHTFKSAFEYDRVNKRWQTRSSIITSVVNLDNIYLKKEYIRNF